MKNLGIKQRVGNQLPTLQKPSTQNHYHLFAQFEQK